MVGSREGEGGSEIGYSRFDDALGFRRSSWVDGSNARGSGRADERERVPVYFVSSDYYIMGF